MLILLIKCVLMYFVITGCCPSASGKIISGQIETHKDWTFLTRFCFFPSGGQFNFTVSYPVRYATQSILLYFDDESQWNAVYKNHTMTCKQREKILKRENGQIISLNVDEEYSGCAVVKHENEDYLNCSHYRQFRTKRERWWYLAVSNCSPKDKKQGLKLYYELIMVNNRTPELKHLSADEYYILHTDGTFLGLYLILLIACIVQSFQLMSRRLFHVTYQLFLLSVVFETIGISCLLAYYVQFVIHGHAREGIKITGKGFTALSSVVFLLLLILLSKGYTITRARLKSFSSAVISMFISVYFAIYALLFFFEQHFFDPAEVLYTYESAFGCGLIILRLYGLVAFTWWSYRTVQMYPAKRGFFIIMYILYCVWFASIPIVIMLATFAIPKYMREQIVNGFELGVAFRAHLFFMLITWPAKCNKIFPYHVRTNQIDVMTKTGKAGDDTLDRFTHYQYAPKRPQTMQNGRNEVQIVQTLPLPPGLIRMSELKQFHTATVNPLPMIG